MSHISEEQLNQYKKAKKLEILNEQIKTLEDSVGKIAERQKGGTQANQKHIFFKGKFNRRAEEKDRRASKQKGRRKRKVGQAL